MVLGDVLAGLTDETAAAELILGLGDLSLLAAMRKQADTEGVDLASYAREAVQRYTSHASDEEWVTMMGLINRGSDPGQTCLKRAFENALRDQMDVAL